MWMNIIHVVGVITFRMWLVTRQCGNCNIQYAVCDKICENDNTQYVVSNCMQLVIIKL